MTRAPASSTSPPAVARRTSHLAQRDGLAVLDPIDEFGVFRDGYAWQTGRFAGATPDAADDLAPAIAADLEAKGLLVARETYRHHYPVCWRCSTQLLFRLVDEWFIAMDPLREEISGVTRQVHWIPDGIGLEERELDWLRNMRDWMISKKRYYGLALPFWVCEACGEFEVIGSKDELRERAVAGWESFEGHTPHRPWIDAVEIDCPACGGRSRRITDVGNPWLDAGIVAYSTLNWATDPAYWEEWFPADFITESFPGQFRNWFYALLTMSTVLTNRPPTRTLLGHALVRDVHGEEMHKSKGNAIWFDDAAEEIGADVMRWLYAAANPAVNVNFGYETGAEVVRRFLLPLWNTYGFLVMYARLDGWTPPRQARPLGTTAGQTALDRWILSRLDGLVSEARASPRRVRRGPGHPAGRDLRGRAVELVRPSQPTPVLEGRARCRQAGRVPDPPRGPDHPDPGPGPVHPARHRCAVAQPGRGRRPGGARQRPPRRLPGGPRSSRRRDRSRGGARPSGRGPGSHGAGRE